MAASRGISGVGVAMAGAGGLLAYAAFTNKTIPDALRSVMKGDITPVTGGVTVSPPADPPAAGGSKYESSSNLGAVFDSSRDSAGSALGSAAAKYRGRPYAWGKTFSTPTEGGDCSGLIYRAYHDLGYNTPRLTSGGYLVWTAMGRAPNNVPAPGDILWYPGHVAIAWSGGQMIEAPTFFIPVRVVKIRAGFTALRPKPTVLAEYRRDARQGA
jgi:cell wall-associated NlpC family hydrolase